jgi:hypothetical protein
VATLTINGTAYNFPNTSDEQWGDNVTNWATAVSSHLLQKTGGTFTLTAEIDFGATYGLKTAYYKSQTANVASAGQVRLAKTDTIKFRNNANGADIAIALDGSDNITLGGNVPLTNPMTTLGDVIYGGAAGVVTRLVGDTSNTRKFLRTLSVVGVATAPGWDTLVAGDIPNISAALITSGTLAAARGGSGISNAGTFTWGANNITVTTAGVTAVTWPTSGTFATLDGIETFTNKTLTSPTLTTPALGVATATTINKVTITTPAASATLTIANLKTLTVSNTLTFTGTDGSSVALGTGGTVSYLGTAVQADQETASSTAVAVVPGVQQYHPSASKFWVKADTAGAVSVSYNVTSVTDTGTGVIDVTIATDFSSANWCAFATVFGNAGGTAATTRVIDIESTNFAAGTCRGVIVRPDTGAVLDPATGWFIGGFGDQ